MEEHSFQFYGTFHRFEFALNQDMSLLDYPYGLLGSCVDLSGRGIGTKRRKQIISGQGKKLKILEYPTYLLIGEHNPSKLQKILSGYSPEKRDLPYASISTSALAVGDAGDDFYLNTLFFMTKGYGILTEISAIAGRDIEDCCSPEYYYKAYKVQLESNPLKRIQENEIISGASIAEWNVYSSPEIITPLRIKFNESSKIRRFDCLIDKLFYSFNESDLTI